MRNLRPCLRESIPQIAEAAAYLNAAVSAHLDRDFKLAAELITRADMPEIRAWTESLWGKNSPYVVFRAIPDAPPILPVDSCVKRMPGAAVKKRLHARDGFHCRFCGIPLIRKETRDKIKKAYPESLLWGTRNAEQHAAFQAMWVQYDHLLPHSRGGTNDIENMVITCAPCNYGRMDYLPEEVGLLDPRTREPLKSEWDGLERFR